MARTQLWEGRSWKFKITFKSKAPTSTFQDMWSICPCIWPRGPWSDWAKIEILRGRKPESGKRDTWETSEGANTLWVHATPLREKAEFGGRKSRVGEDVSYVGTLGFSSSPLGTELLGRTIQRLQVSSSGERHTTHEGNVIFQNSPWKEHSICLKEIFLKPPK